MTGENQGVDDQGVDRRLPPGRIGAEDWRKFVFYVVSCEWALSGRNGGGRILLRSTIISSGLFALAIATHSFADPTASWTFDWREMRREIYANFTWLGPIFAGVYAALYTRFASQWQYLSGVYNAIKASECERCSQCENFTTCPCRATPAIAQWKAAFIEDCLSLHVAGRRVFATIIWFWIREDDVAQFFAKSNGYDCVVEVRKRLESGGSMEFRSIRKACTAQREHKAEQSQIPKNVRTGTAPDR